MQTLIVPLDGSEGAERALPTVAALVRRSGAAVIVLTAEIGGVVEHPIEYLDRAARAAGIDEPQTLVVKGQFAATAIATTAKTAAEPVVCMATHARSGWRRALFSSVAEETLQVVEAPVLLVGPHVADAAPEPSLVVVCTDGSPAAQAILETAGDTAAALGLEVVVITVATGAEGEAATAEVERVAAELAAQGVTARGEVIDATDAPGAIVEYVRDRPGAILALATHGRTGLARMTVGSVTMAVVADAPVPVLTVRPSQLD